ncbi:MAG: M18 family aminopeptidase [Actinobacteria bacterium]|nr:M18 family aminopeptidase [Actinomycetota bacterium]
MTVSSADDLIAFIDDSPSPYHAANNAAALLAAAGFSDATGNPGALPQLGYLRSGAMLLAWAQPAEPDGIAAVRIVGAHTDSPNLRIKPHADLGGSGMRRLAAEPYGGALLNSWLDRDLGLSGRVALRRGDAVVDVLFRVDEPVLRVPQLAIHLDRDVSSSGLLLNKQQHLNPVWGLGDPEPGEFVSWLAEAIDADPDDIVGWEAMCHDLTPSRRIGVDRELLAAPRLDNLCSSFGALQAVLAAGGDHDSIVIAALFDHEEIGSETATGAGGPHLAALVERLWSDAGATPGERAEALGRSRILSADMAHGTHPNYPERHEPNHHITLGGGPVLKVNVNGRYATDSLTGGEFMALCRDLSVPSQTYAHRADLACGSTIGPISAARLGIATADVGMAQLSMHSARELMAVDDVDHMVRAFTAWALASV